MFKLATATAVMANQLPTDLAALQGADIPKLQAQIRRRLQGEFGNSTGNGNDQTQLTPALTATWQEKCRYICKDANVFSRGVCYVVCSFLLVDDVNGIGRDFITPNPATPAPTTEAEGTEAKGSPSP